MACRAAVLKRTRSHMLARPLPLSTASSPGDNLYPTGPSPYPCPGVDTPFEGYSPLPSSRRRGIALEFEDQAGLDEGGGFGVEESTLDALAEEVAAADPQAQLRSQDVAGIEAEVNPAGDAKDRISAR